MMGVPVELHMTSGGEVRQSTALRAIKEMTSKIEGFTLVDHKWETWNKFITLVSTMDLLIQVSYTESFNMITADGISVGVPSVVSPVITGRRTNGRLIQTMRSMWPEPDINC